MGSRQPRASPFLELISDLVADVGRSGCIGVEDAIIPLFPDFPPGGDDDTVGLLRLGRRLGSSDLTPPALEAALGLLRASGGSGVARKNAIPDCTRAGDRKSVV